MEHAQTTTKPITAASSETADIIAAAKERAAFWKYPADSSWTVSVNLPGGRRGVEVRHDANTGKYEVIHPRQAA